MIHGPGKMVTINLAAHLSILFTCFLNVEETNLNRYHMTSEVTSQNIPSVFLDMCMFFSVDMHLYEFYLMITFHSYTPELGIKVIFCGKEIL